MNNEKENIEATRTLSFRDQAAIAILSGMLADPSVGNDESDEDFLVASAFKMADKLEAERQKRSPK